jgi:hypothetical protein
VGGPGVGTIVVGAAGCYLGDRAGSAAGSSLGGAIGGWLTGS